MHFLGIKKLRQFLTQFYTIYSVIDSLQYMFDVYILLSQVWKSEASRVKSGYLRLLVKVPVMRTKSVFFWEPNLVSVWHLFTPKKIIYSRKHASKMKGWIRYKDSESGQFFPTKKDNFRYLLQAFLTGFGHTHSQHHSQHFYVSDVCV